MSENLARELRERVSRGYLPHRNKEEVTRKMIGILEGNYNLDNHKLMSLSRHRCSNVVPELSYS